MTAGAAAGAPGADERAAWLRIDYDQARWIPCLPVFPAGHDRRSWAALYAATWWEASGLDHDRCQVEGLARSLEFLHQLAYTELPCHLAFIHLPGPLAIPLLVCVGVWPSEGGREQQLRQLVHADTKDALRPPVVDRCRARGLGEGSRCLCYLRRGDSAVTGCLSYGWRSEPLRTAVRIFTACDDLGRLQAALPDIEALTQVTDYVALLDILDVTSVTRATREA